MKDKFEITHELGLSFWLGISFLGGCFTNNWYPFGAVLVLQIFGVISRKVEKKTQEKDVHVICEVTTEDNSAKLVGIKIKCNKASGHEGQHQSAEFENNVKEPVVYKWGK